VLLLWYLWLVGRVELEQLLLVRKIVCVPDDHHGAFVLDHAPYDLTYEFLLVLEYLHAGELVMELQAVLQRNSVKTKTERHRIGYESMR
jgi:hypothetical protein